MKALPGFLRRQWIARPLAAFAVCFLLGLLWGDDCPLPIALMLVLAVAFEGIHWMFYFKAGRRECAFAALAAVLHYIKCFNHFTLAFFRVLIQ